MARGKALYDGHAVAAVAAISPAIAEQALDLIEVEYEVLPHVIDVEAAMAPDAPVLHDDIFTAGVEPKPTKPSNIAKMVRFAKGDVEAGFAEAEVVDRARATRRKPVHQAYIEPHACVVSVGPDGQCTIWSSSQGQFMVRAYTARIVGADIANIRAIPAEIGGGFGGKTIVYLEPVAYVLSKKSGRRGQAGDEPRRGVPRHRPDLGRRRRGQARRQEGRHAHRGQGRAQIPGRRVPGLAGRPGLHVRLCLLRPAERRHHRLRRGEQPAEGRGLPRARRADLGVRRRKRLDELARELGIDPLALREMNGAKDGTKAAHGPTWVNIGYLKTLEAARGTEHLKAKLGPNQGRGIASGFWHNAGGESSAAVHVNEDGTVTVTEGHPDIGGSRASMAMMVAEVLGVPFENVRPVVGDTTAIGFSASTGGSRVTFAGGMAVTQAAEKVVEELKKRAAVTWDISPEAVEWKDGKALPAGPNAGGFEPLPWRSSRPNRRAPAGRSAPRCRSTRRARGRASPPISAMSRSTARPATSRSCATPRSRMSAGRSIPPTSRARCKAASRRASAGRLNEEYIYDKDGKLENAGFLDYRVPVASDMPMIDTIMVEVPNPRHPFGARGVGEVPIVPPMAAVANAIADATGIRLRDLPMSPPRLLAALDQAAPMRQAAE